MEKCYKVLLKVIKNIFCNEKYIDDCNKCSLCHLIDLNNLPSLQIIEPDGSFIKKDQIKVLKNLFSKSSQITDKTIYIIKDCEKMNKESANTFLKFLEEPSENVIGFLITNHSDNVIPTIQSRCQLIEANFANELYEQLGLSKEDYDGYVNIVSKYLSSIEYEKKELILYNREFFSDMEKEQLKKIFQIILNIYQLLLTNRKEFLDNYPNISFLEQYSLNNIIKKNNLIIEFLEEITYNVNIDLLLDKFVIEMDGINHETL